MNTHLALFKVSKERLCESSAKLREIIGSSPKFSRWAKATLYLFHYDSSLLLPLNDYQRFKLKC